jgi:hypothetical protein
MNGLRPMPEATESPTGAAPRSPSASGAAGDHHPSHVKLLAYPKVPAGGRSALDAIVVPSARASWNLEHAARLAAAEGCPLLVLCSKRADADAAVSVGDKTGTDVVAVNVTGREPFVPPAAFETTRMLAGTRFATPSDLSFKRNAGLALSRMAGWRSILFLDDDIHGVPASTVADAATLLGPGGAVDIVGLRNNGFPDNSVLCHAFRAAGGQQDTFIGGGALAVSVDRVRAFFPDVYNEDWLFFVRSLAAGRAAVTGVAAQESYDPFASPRRARFEEFGDCLAEGIYYLLDQGGSVDDADGPFWSDFIARRRRFIVTVKTLAEKASEGAASDRTVRALRASLDSNILLTSHRYVRYLDCWRGDTARWNDWFDSLDIVGDVELALEKLEVGFSSTGRRRRAVAAAAHVEPPAVPAPTATSGWRQRFRFRRPIAAPAPTGVVVLSGQAR